MYEVECTCEPIAADVWSARNCEVHGLYVVQSVRPDYYAVADEREVAF